MRLYLKTLSFEQLVKLWGGKKKKKKKKGMALTAGLPPMPPPRSLPSWKREGERAEKDRVHLSQVSDGRSGAQLTALLRARLACCVQDRQKCNDGKAQGTEGLFLLLCEQSYLENYPAHLLRTGAYCRLIRIKPHPPVIFTTNSAQFFMFYASVLSLQPTTLAASSPEQLHKTQWGNCEME